MPRNTYNCVVSIVIEIEFHFLPANAHYSCSIYTRIGSHYETERKQTEWKRNIKLASLNDKPISELIKQKKVQGTLRTIREVMHLASVDFLLRTELSETFPWMKSGYQLQGNNDISWPEPTSTELHHSHLSPSFYPNVSIILKMSQQTLPLHNFNKEICQVLH